MAKRPPQPDCYDYVRRYYRVPAFIGVKVRVRGRAGILVASKHHDQYLHVQFDGETKADIYHPTDGVEYLLDLLDRQAVCCTTQRSVELT
jgi:hypothetical protein